MTTQRFILLPGIGADARLFEPQRKVFSNLLLPEWMAPEPTESLSSYGRRMASTIRETGPFFLGGVSFGGMVALEMASHLSPKAVFLISSCRSGRQIPRSLRWVERCSRWLPNTLFDRCRPLSPMIFRIFGKSGPEEIDLALEMFAETETSFIRWACRVITTWSYDGDLSMPVRQIHGDCDLVIPHRNMNIDHLIPNAGHLAVVTHSEAVNSALLSFMNNDANDEPT